MSDVQATEKRGVKLSYLWSQVRRFVLGRELVHCWADGRDDDYRGYTCMRAYGHIGPHEWVSDGEIGVSFP